MASSSHSISLSDKNEAGGNCFDSPTPHFFKSIPRSSLQCGKIAVPKTFVRKYGNDLSNKVILEVPNGEIWEISLEKNGGDFWLKKGWEDFIEHYSIGENYLVVFRHEGESVFKVVIFDESSTEIAYPLKPRCEVSPTESMENSGSEHDIADSEPIEILSCSEPEAEESSESDDDLILDSSLESRRAKKGQGKQRREHDHQHPPQQLRGRVRNRALHQDSRSLNLHSEFEAMTFRSQHPFFLVRMTKSYVKKGSVAVPRKFICGNNIAVDSHRVRLQHSGKTWPVRMFCYANGRGGSFCSGFIKFSRQNSLQEGDICIFELIKKKGIVFKVNIFRSGG